MSTEEARIVVAGLDVTVVRKAIKNLHLGVYPPDGRVRVAAPPSLSDEAVRLVVVNRLAWINRQRERFAGQARQSERHLLSGETHYLFGRRYRLSVVEAPPFGEVSLRPGSIVLRVRAESTKAEREAVLLAWCRRKLKERVAPAVIRWSAALGVEPPGWQIKRMKTKWGSCNVSARRIWLNLELAKKPAECLDYVICHELVHLLERNHSDQFVAMMDALFPRWRMVREELNALPLSAEIWS